MKIRSLDSNEIRRSPLGRTILDSTGVDMMLLTMLGVFAFAFFWVWLCHVLKIPMAAMYFVGVIIIVVGVLAAVGE